VLIKSLPTNNVVLLEFIFRFLTHIAAYSDHNMMTLENIAIAIAPSIFPVDDENPLNFLNKTRQAIGVTAMLMSHHQVLFAHVERQEFFQEDLQQTGSSSDPQSIADSTLREENNDSREENNDPTEEKNPTTTETELQPSMDLDSVQPDHVLTVSEGPQDLEVSQPDSQIEKLDINPTTETSSQAVSTDTQIENLGVNLTTEQDSSQTVSTDLQSYSQPDTQMEDLDVHPTTEDSSQTVSTDLQSSLQQTKTQKTNEHASMDLTN